MWRNLRRSLRYLLPFWHFQALALCCALAAVALSMVNPWVNKVLIDDVVINKDVGRLNFVCLLFLGSVLLGQLFGMLQTISSPSWARRPLSTCGPISFATSISNPSHTSTNSTRAR